MNLSELILINSTFVNFSILLARNIIIVQLLKNRNDHFRKFICRKKIVHIAVNFTVELKE